MKNYLIDSEILIYFLKGSSEVVMRSRERRDPIDLALIFYVLRRGAGDRFCSYFVMSFKT